MPYDTIQQVLDGGLTADYTVSLECSGKGEFAEPMSHHIFSHEHINECLSVVDTEIMSYEFGYDH